MPFDVWLDTFYATYYPGTTAPADYVSHIHLANPQGGETMSGKVFTNDILTYKGYRFYLSSFEEDWNTSVLSVNRDIEGDPYYIYRLRPFCRIPTVEPGFRAKYLS